MRGLISPWGLLSLLAIVVLFTNVLFDIPLYGAKCAREGFGNESCPQFFASIGGVVFAADEKIDSGVNDIIYLTEKKQSLPPELASMADNMIFWSKIQIAAGFLTLFIFIFYLSKFFLWLTPSSNIDLFSKVIAIIFAILLIGTVEMVYTTFFLKKPTFMYSGVINFFMHPDILLKTADTLSLLPGVTTAEDFLRNETTGREYKAYQSEEETTTGGSISKQLETADECKSFCQNLGAVKWAWSQGYCVCYFSL